MVLPCLGGARCIMKEATACSLILLVVILSLFSSVWGENIDSNRLHMVCVSVKHWIHNRIIIRIIIFIIVIIAIVIVIIIILLSSWKKENLPSRTFASSTSKSPSPSVSYATSLPAAKKNINVLFPPRKWTTSHSGLMSLHFELHREMQLATLLFTTSNY